MVSIVDALPLRDPVDRFERLPEMTRSFLPRRGVLASVAVAAALVLSACGGSDSSSSGSGHGGMTMSPSGAPASAAAFNDADVTFAQAMIPHHQQAVEMAALAGGRATSAEVKDLAAKIKAAQQPEIDTMTGWLTAWGRPAAMPGMSMSPDMGGMNHSSMPGMMSDADMNKLAGAKGAAFDKQFLTMMISHHEGAITMARQESAQGSNPDAVALAKTIVTDQEAEITTMKDMLTKL
jgi:uncharacterized protein (DUF305 family)